MATKTATKPATKSERIDPRDTIIDALIESMADNNAPWQKPWSTDQIQALVPHNATTGHVYSGVNAFWLTLLASERGYTSNGWATFKQMQALGGSVKGEKGTTIVLWKPFQPKDAKTGKPAVDDKGNPKMAGVFRAFTVFHESQITGATFPERPTPEPVESPAAVQRIIENSEVSVTHAGAAAYYRPSAQTITMPYRESFATPEAYAAVLLHEMAHWTGHESRLDRDHTGAFGSDKYAAEELVAEMGAFLTAMALGVQYQPTNHEAYLKHWSRGDLTLVKGAAGAAKKASDMLLTFK